MRKLLESELRKMWELNKDTYKQLAVAILVLGIAAVIYESIYFLPDFFEEHGGWEVSMIGLITLILSSIFYLVHKVAGGFTKEERIITELKRAKELLDLGLMTQEQYEDLRKKLTLNK